MNLSKILEKHVEDDFLPFSACCMTFKAVLCVEQQNKGGAQMERARENWVDTYLNV